MSPHRRPGDIHRPFSIILAVALLASITTVRSQWDDAVPPAMVAFFRGSKQPKEANATEPVWGAGRFEPFDPDRSIRSRRTILLVVGTACGLVGVGLIAAGAVIYAVQVRRSGRTGPHPSVRRSGPEVRLGSPSPA